MRRIIIRADRNAVTSELKWHPSTWQLQHKQIWWQRGQSVQLVTVYLWCPVYLAPLTWPIPVQPGVGQSPITDVPNRYKHDNGIPLLLYTFWQLNYHTCQMQLIAWWVHLITIHPYPTCIAGNLQRLTIWEQFNWIKVRLLRFNSFGYQLYAHMQSQNI